jgi:hypothetical protein
MTKPNQRTAAESSLGGSAPAHALGGGMDDAQSRLTESGGRGWCTGTSAIDGLEILLQITAWLGGTSPSHAGQGRVAALQGRQATADRQRHGSPLGTCQVSRQTSSCHVCAHNGPFPKLLLKLAADALSI